jgi:hypothetical protein
MLGAGTIRVSARSTPQGGDGLLQFLPDGVGVVIVDVRQILGSQLWSTLSSQSKFKGTIDKAEALVGELGVRLSDVNAVAVGFPAAGFKDPTIAIGGVLNQNDLLARLRADQKVSLTSEIYKGFEVFSVRSAEQTTKGDSGVSFVFYDFGTAVVGNQATVKAALDTRAGATTSIAQNQKLAGVLAQNPTAAIRFAIEITPKMAGALQSNDLPLPDFSSVNLVFGTVDVASSLDLNATLRNDTPEHAAQVSERLNGVLQMAKGFLASSNDPKLASLVSALKSFSISGADVDVKIVGSVPAELLAQLFR